MATWLVRNLYKTPSTGRVPLSFWSLWIPSLLVGLFQKAISPLPSLIFRGGLKGKGRSPPLLKWGRFEPWSKTGGGNLCFWLFINDYLLNWQPTSSPKVRPAGGSDPDPKWGGISRGSNKGRDEDPDSLTYSFTRSFTYSCFLRYALHYILHYSLLRILLCTLPYTLHHALH